MEKKLSKHGKYWIITGTPEELYDDMQAGDIVKDFTGEWHELLHIASVDDLTPITKMFVDIFGVPDSIWWGRHVSDSEEEEYIPFFKHSDLVKIKRPVANETHTDKTIDVGSMPVGYLHFGTLKPDEGKETEKPEAKKAESETTEPETKSDEKELPKGEGLYTDSVGCLWLFVYEDCVMRRYFYSTITHRMLLDINGGIAKKSAPFRLVKNLEQEAD